MFCMFCMFCCICCCICCICWMDCMDCIVVDGCDGDMATTGDELLRPRAAIMVKLIGNLHAI